MCYYLNISYSVNFTLENSHRVSKLKTRYYLENLLCFNETIDHPGWAMAPVPQIIASLIQTRGIIVSLRLATQQAVAGSLHVLHRFRVQIPRVREQHLEDWRQAVRCAQAQAIVVGVHEGTGRLESCSGYPARLQDRAYDRLYHSTWSRGRWGLLNEERNLFWYTLHMNHVTWSLHW